MKADIQELGQFLRKHLDWCFLFAVYLLAWIIPFKWMEDFWVLQHSFLIAQPFLLPGFLLILWGRRKAISTYWAKLNRWTHGSAKIKTEGNLSLLIIGCLIYFFSYFSRLSLAAILGLALILLGVIFRVYGKTLIRFISAPVIYFLAIVPWLPEVFFGKISSTIYQLHLILSRILLKIFNIHVFSVNGALLVNNTNAPFDFSMYGGNITISMIVFFWGYGLYKQMSTVRIVYMVITGCVVSFTVHQLRLALIFISTTPMPPLAKSLASANSWIFVIASLILTLVALQVLSKIKQPVWLGKISQSLSRISSRIQRPIDTALDKSAVVGLKAGSAILVIFRPLVWVLDQVIRLGGKFTTWIGRTNRNLDTKIRRADRYFENKKKRK
jgi:hypothetical protein